MKKTLYIILILLISLPGFIARFSNKPDFDLSGENQIGVLKPQINLKSFINNEMQDSIESYLSNNSGFRGFVIRTFNQIDYSFFNTAHGDKAIIAKNKILLDEWYINAWLGRTYIGDDAINSKLYKIKMVQDTLTKKGIKFLFILEPDKATFYEDKIPHRIKILKQEKTNYKQIAIRSKEININYLDLQKYFLEIKDTCKFPLYPKSGIHWSTYGSYIALNKMTERIEQELNTDLNDIYWKSSIVSHHSEGIDYDLGRNINILFPIHQPLMRYPQLEFENNSNKKKPNMIVVGDSYYFNQYNTKFTYSLFNNNDFWYYNKTVYPDTYLKGKTTVQDINWIQRVEQQDIILLMVTSRFMHTIDWLFIDKLFTHYYPNLKWSNIDSEISKIQNDDPWFYKIMDKAEKSNIPLSIQKDLDAEYVRDKKATNQYRTIKSYIDEIKASPKWLKIIKNKAKQNRILEKDQIIKDAIYMAKHQTPQTNHKELEQIISDIKSDSKWYNKICKKATQNNISIEQQLKIDAEWVLNN